MSVFSCYPKHLKDIRINRSEAFLQEIIFLLMLKIGKPVTAGLEHMFCKLRKVRKSWVIPIDPVLTFPSSDTETPAHPVASGVPSVHELPCLSC